jgi:hypothetical protein
MTDIALFHTTTYRAGEAGYHGPRPRGHLEVRHDSKRYLYDLRGLRVKASEARSFVESAWDTMNGIRVTGRYPSYEVESL